MGGYEVNTTSCMDIENQNYVKLKVNGAVVTALLDTGAAKTLMSEELANRLRVYRTPS